MIFVDTNVLMYAAGGEHPLQRPCRVVVDAIGARTLEATTSAEVVQEIVHRYLSIGRVGGGLALAEDTMDLFTPVLPITHALMRRVPEYLPASGRRVGCCLHHDPSQ